MFRAIQELVDDLADDLDRAVVVEDERHALIAHSPHRRDVDPIRERSVFDRQTPSEMIEWCTAQGLRDAPGPVRLPPNPALGAESRVSVPIRHGGVLLGFVTVLDAPQTLGPDAFDRCGDVAASLAELLDGLRSRARAAPARERELTDVLLDGRSDPAACERAGAALVGESRLSAGTVAVVVVVPRHDRGARQAGAQDAALAHVGRRGRRAVPGRLVAAAVRADHVALLVPLDTATAQRPGDAARLVEHAVAPLTASGVLSRRPVVGYAEAAAGWHDVAPAHRRARAAARVAASVGDTDAGPLGWSQLGVYQLLTQLPPEELGRTTMDERVRRLADKPELLQTLEVYLDLAGDAKHAAERLALHRASLYYRLRRIEETAGIDLKSGTDRLAAHLAVKALRLLDDPAL
jgi:hypothetical protein